MAPLTLDLALEVADTLKRNLANAINGTIAGTSKIQIERISDIAHACDLDRVLKSATDIKIAIESNRDHLISPDAGPDHVFVGDVVTDPAQVSTLTNTRGRLPEFIFVLDQVVNSRPFDTDTVSLYFFWHIGTYGIVLDAILANLQERMETPALAF